MQPHWRRYATLEFFSRHIGIAGDEDYLNIRIKLPDLTSGLHAVNTWRHSHIEDHYIKRMAIGGSFFRNVDRVITLAAGDKLEFRRLLDRGVRIEQLCVQRIQRFHVVGRIGLTECFPITVEDMFVVVRNQDADTVIAMLLCINDVASLCRW